jgi:hypothetical protein
MHNLKRKKYLVSCFFCIGMAMRCMQLGCGGEGIVMLALPLFERFSALRFMYLS